jgi:arginine-tRNA-protein transferase
MNNQKSQLPPLNIGITAPFPCSYLADKEERLIMLIDSEMNAPYFYPSLLAQGFRRNGDQLYRPQCDLCQSCHSLRVPVELFSASRSQKRIMNKNKAFNTRLATQTNSNYYPLYQNYIDTVHQDGSMYPATLEQYNGFITSTWNQPLYLEVYDEDKLIVVSVIDQVQSRSTKAWSAFYCFFDPSYQKHSLGKFAVLSQLKLAKQHGVDWLYLGYQIDACKKMNYKTEFKPHQRFINNEWQ